MAQSGASTTNNVPEILKSIWDDEVHDYQYEDEVFYALIEKDTSWDGLAQIVTVKLGGGGSGSGKFDRAKANKAPSRFAKMTIESQDDFQLWSVDNKLITLTRNTRGALIKALGEATEQAQAKFKRSTVRKLWGNGGGAIGKVGAISGSVITLDDVNDVRNFDFNDVHEFAEDDGVANGGTWAGRLTVDGIDEDTGEITYSSPIAGIAGLDVGDYIFRDGDYGAVMHGVPAYVTTSAPGVNGVPTSIHGMLRTTHPQRLSGHRFTGSNNQIGEELMNALTKAFRRNCKTTHIFLEPEMFNEFSMSLEGQRRYADEKVGKIGFTGLELLSQSGKTVKCFGDPSIRKSPSGNSLIWGLNMDSWKLHSAQDYPMWLNAKNDESFMVEENANAREGRLGGYSEAYTNAAGENWVLELS